MNLLAHIGSFDQTNLLMPLLYQVFMKSYTTFAGMKFILSPYFPHCFHRNLSLLLIYLFIYLFIGFKGLETGTTGNSYIHSEKIFKLMTGIILITSDYLNTNDATYLPKCILWMFLPDGGPHLMREDQVPRLTSWLFSFLSQEKMEGRKLPNGFN